MKKVFQSAVLEIFSKLVCGFVVFSATVTAGAQGATVVAPNAHATTPGGGSLGPFGQDFSRYLNIYNASEFLSVIPEGGIITGISLRLDETVTGPVAATVPGLQVRMSTSPVPPGTISPVFSGNIGLDESVVFQGDLRFESAGSMEIPRPFQSAVPLDIPFYYDPRNGGLTVELRTSAQATGPIPIDAGAGATALTPDFGDRVGFVFLGAVMQFQFIPVPEPQIWVIIALGSTFLALLKIRRKEI